MGSSVNKAYRAIFQSTHFFEVHHSGELEWWWNLIPLATHEFLTLENFIFSTPQGLYRAPQRNFWDQEDPRVTDQTRLVSTFCDKSRFFLVKLSRNFVQFFIISAFSRAEISFNPRELYTKVDRIQVLEWTANFQLEILEGTVWSHWDFGFDNNIWIGAQRYYTTPRYGAREYDKNCAVTLRWRNPLENNESWNWQADSDHDTREILQIT